MKLKRVPEDFQVEEQIALQPTGGPFALYRLTKSSLGTPEAIDAVVQRWRIPRGNIAFAGLKDRHALTAQFITIDGGPRQAMRQQSLQLEYLGQVERPIHASDIAANAFAVVVRDLAADQLASMEQALAAVSRDGLPNYFDDQRFGSLGESGEFIAKPWCLGDFERALWLAIADANVHDRPDEQKQKAILRECWGNWTICKARLEPSDRRDIVVSCLAGSRPDFRRALVQVRQDLRSLWLAAFQSHLWNQMLAALLRETCPGQSLPTETIGQREAPFFLSLTDEQRQLLHATRLPLPSARLHLDEGPLKSLIDRVMAAEGMELRQVRVKYPRDSFFSKGERSAISLPKSLSSESGADELYPGRQKLTLRFTLDRGQYATILIKRITGGSREAIETATDM